MYLTETEKLFHPKQLIYCFLFFIRYYLLDCVMSKAGLRLIYICFKAQIVEIGMVRSSRLQIFFKIGVLKNFAIFTGKHLCLCLFNKVAGLKSCNFIKKRLQHRCFPVNIVKFLRIPILKNIYERLFLIMAIWLCFSRKFAVRSRRNQIF